MRTSPATAPMVRSPPDAPCAPIRGPLTTESPHASAPRPSPESSAEVASAPPTSTRKFDDVKLYLALRPAGSVGSEDSPGTREVGRDDLARPRGACAGSARPYPRKSPVIARSGNRRFVNALLFTLLVGFFILRYTVRRYARRELLSSPESYRISRTGR